MDPQYIGEIAPFALRYVPLGWRLCDGSVIPIAQNENLFRLIRNRFGGDGITTFALPDLRSRIPLGHGEHYPVGQKGGSESVLLTSGELPPHRHFPACSTSERADSKNATNAFWSASGGARYASAPGLDQMNLDSIQSEGKGEPHENRMPIFAVRYCISMEGIFPQGE